MEPNRKKNSLRDLCLQTRCQSPGLTFYDASGNWAPGFLHLQVPLLTHVNQEVAEFTTGMIGTQQILLLQPALFTAYWQHLMYLLFTPLARSCGQGGMCTEAIVS